MFDQYFWAIYILVELIFVIQFTVDTIKIMLAIQTFLTSWIKYNCNPSWPLVLFRNLYTGLCHHRSWSVYNIEWLSALEWKESQSSDWWNVLGTGHCNLERSREGISNNWRIQWTCRRRGLYEGTFETLTLFL